MTIARASILVWYSSKFTFTYKLIPIQPSICNHPWANRTTQLNRPPNNKVHLVHGVHKRIQVISRSDDGLSRFLLDVFEKGIFYLTKTLVSWFFGLLGVQKWKKTLLNRCMFCSSKNHRRKEVWKKNICSLKYDYMFWSCETKVSSKNWNLYNYFFCNWQRIELCEIRSKHRKQNNHTI